MSETRVPYLDQVPAVTPRTPPPFALDERVRMRQNRTFIGSVKDLFYSSITETWVVYVLWESGFEWLHGMADLDAIETARHRAEKDLA